MERMCQAAQPALSTCMSLAAALDKIARMWYISKEKVYLFFCLSYVLVCCSFPFHCKTMDEQQNSYRRSEVHPMPYDRKGVPRKDKVPVKSILVVEDDAANGACFAEMIVQETPYYVLLAP